ncbi:MAG: tRNA (adenosine(37)-N6)-threonylcarbamoyltransferase complex ATPase subunit type 1 TsaE [Puniceicoccales bacterium]|jgi:tRNA threonylcarbamoyladenosine biosynthesis protein TsaE|nr:tRNA (adenosine(37)-N6)-threonylcarbamoyltransferase complex ATPase subunit type 1 TsaE [Puniceicoccales bacterium]
MDELVGSEVICKTAEETRAFGMRFAKFLPPNQFVALVGDLGSGKTTFVRGMAAGFGIHAAVTSPSFNILNTYSGNATLLHADAYRLDGTEYASSSLMLEDFLTEPYCLVVEWPERLHGFLETCDFIITFELSGKYRKITAKKT